MDINRFYEFIVLAEQLNYSKAAAQLFLTQPVLSRHISDLEKQLGVQLLDRNTRRVHLTTAGKAFVQEARDVTARYELAVARIQSVSNTTNGTLSAGFPHCAVHSLMSDLTIRFTREYPHLQLSTHILDLPALVRGLDAGTLDVIFIPDIYDTRIPGLKRRPIMWDRLCALLQRRHPLANDEGPISLSELDNVPLITFSHESTFCRSLFEQHGLSYNAAAEAPDVEAAIFHAATTCDILLLPEHLICLRSSGLLVRPLTDENCLIPIHIVSKTSNLNPFIDLFPDSFSHNSAAPVPGGSELKKEQ